MGDMTLASVLSDAGYVAKNLEELKSMVQTMIAKLGLCDAYLLSMDRAGN